jgi:hypothetical protein
MAAIHQEAARLRAADIAQIHECYGTQSERGRELASELVASLGVVAFTDDAVCKLAGLHADQVTRDRRGH